MTPSRIAIIQARMSSSRLPGKVLADIAGKPLLQHMLERVRQASSLDEVVVATTIDPSDDILVRFCRKQAISCFRGSLTDVLDRCYQSAAQFHADTIIRLTADCPLIDPGVLDLTVAAFQGNNSPANQPVHFAANRLPPPWQRTLPIGLDVEVCSFAALQRAWKEANQPYQREHVMPYLYEDVVFQEATPFPGQEWFIQSGETPRGFKVSLLNHSPDFGFLRWTVDTPADLEFVRQVFSRFDGLVGFTWQDVLALLEKEPDLASINADVKHKTAFDVDQRSLGH